MNHTKVLGGLILFATANVFAMGKEDNSTQGTSSNMAKITIVCGLCKKTIATGASKHAYHRECLLKDHYGENYSTVIKEEEESKKD